MFEAQMVEYYIGVHEQPNIFIGTHPDLDRVMSADWLEAMHEGWKDKAHDELVQMLADGKIKWSVTRIGSVQSMVKLNHYETRLFLHLPDKKNNPRKWTIVMEPVPPVTDDSMTMIAVDRSESSTSRE